MLRTSVALLIIRWLYHILARLLGCVSWWWRLRTWRCFIHLFALSALLVLALSLLRTYLLAIYTYVFDTYTRIPRRVLLRRCCCSYGALSLRDRCRSHRSTSHAFTRTHKFQVRTYGPKRRRSEELYAAASVVDERSASICLWAPASWPAVRTLPSTGGATRLWIVQRARSIESFSRSALREWRARGAPWATIVRSEIRSDQISYGDRRVRARE